MADQQQKLLTEMTWQHNASNQQRKNCPDKEVHTAGVLLEGIDELIVTLATFLT